MNGDVRAMRIGGSDAAQEGLFAWLEGPQKGVVFYPVRTHCVAVFMFVLFRVCDYCASPSSLLLTPLFVCRYVHVCRRYFYPT